jgi:hypothetical protein
MGRPWAQTKDESLGQMLDHVLDKLKVLELENVMDTWMVQMKDA